MEAALGSAESDPCFVKASIYVLVYVYVLQVKTACSNS